MLPYAAVLIVGVLAGFVAGYALGSREQAATTPPAATSAPARPTGTEWSEGAVADVPPAAPAAAPGAAADVPLPQPDAPASSAPAASSRASASSAPAASSKGTLVIRTQPGGARVTVNGRRRGVTPLELAELPFGTYTVQVARAGYQSASRRVAISAETPLGRAIFGLRRAASAPAAPASDSTGSLSIDSRPRGARVLLDGRLIGTTPLVLSGVRAGPHVIRLERDGYTRWSSTVRVAGGQRAHVNASLERDRTQ